MLGIKVHVVGCGDAMGSGGRDNTCFVIDDDFGQFAIDFGATSLAALNALSISPDTIEVIFLTHFHGDHFGALPNLFLMRDYASDVVRPLTITGPPGLEARIAGLCDATFLGMWKSEWTFPPHIIEIVPGAPVEISDRLVMTQPVTHFAGPELSTAIRIETSGCAIGFSGDTGWNEVLVEIARKTDVFLCDCFDRYDKPFEGHQSYDTLLENAKRLETDRLLMTHLGPEMINSSETFEIEQAEDGMIIFLSGSTA
jgi:ribonuclease BN (tRNA processing enzyme)